MIRAYRLYKGPDGNSHVIRGSVNPAKLVEAQSVLSRKRRHTFLLTGTASYSSVRHYLGGHA